MKVGRFGRWAARRPDARYLREVPLSPCTHEAEGICPLRGTRELPWGRNPQEAIRSLVASEPPEERCELTTVRRFSYLGPVAQFDDYEAESLLMSPAHASPHWDELRSIAARRRLGMIELKNLKRLMVPILAMRRSESTMHWLREPESSFRTDLALEDEVEPDEESW